MPPFSKRVPLLAHFALLVGAYGILVCGLLGFIRHRCPICFDGNVLEYICVMALSTQLGFVSTPWSDDLMVVAGSQSRRVA